MNNNRENGGLKRSRTLASLGNVLVVLKRTISAEGRARRTLTIHSEPDYLGDMRESIDIMRRRMTI